MSTSWFAVPVSTIKMPTTQAQVLKGEKEECLLEALKSHILKERQRKKEEHEAEVEEERQRKEREARERQDVMTLGETREQIQKLDQNLKELRNRKQQLFLQLKKVLNEDESRKKQQQQKDSEMFAMHSLPTQPPHAQIFLPPRQTHQQLIQKVGPVGLSNPPIKRGRSPSPPPPQSYYKSAAYSPAPKHDDSRRGGEVARVLWNKPQQYQTPPGTLFYQTTSVPPNQPDSRTQSIIYPPYNPNLNIPLRQNYHIELPQPPLNQHQKDQSPKSAQVYHINLDQPPPITQSSPQNGSVQPVQHKPQVTMEKIQDRGGYHVEVKLDPSHQQNHLPEGVYTSLMAGIPMPMPVLQLAPNPNQNPKASGNITQGYPVRGPVHNPPGQPPQSQMHYPRRMY